MMETKEQDRHWHLVRNDNGEWISDENVEFLTQTEARSLQIKARLGGKKLKIQHGYDGTLWCYKHEYLNINNKKVKIMGKISRMKSGQLNRDYELYKILIGGNAPAWWNSLKEDKDIYIEIRKGNVIDAYYLGGRMAEIKLDRDNQIVVTAHPKYLGFLEEDGQYYRKSIKDGKLKYTPIYQDCSEWLLNRKEEMKANIQKYYSGSNNGEKTSEKYIQGMLILKGRDKYLDSEFAHRLYEDKIETVRIDLVKIENGFIVFEELKRIGDNRLRNMKGDPEILTQIKNYRDFLKVNKDILTEYYKTLYLIKKDLELPVPPIVGDVNDLVVNPEPQLLIANNYEKRTKDRDIRIEKIEEILLKIGVKPNYYNL